MSSRVPALQGEGSHTETNVGLSDIPLRHLADRNDDIIWIQSLDTIMNIVFEGLTFDDVLLLPGYSEARRNEVNVSTFLTKEIKLAIPLVSSPMDTVTMAGLAIALAEVGGMGFIHRSLTIVDQAKEVAKVKKTKGIQTTATVDGKKYLRVGAAVGVGEDLEERAKALVSAGADALLVDSAHGLSLGVIEATKKVRKLFPKTPLIAGNIATAEGALRLIQAGADGIRIGMGPGSICTTRIISGMGVPQITAIEEAVSVAKKHGIPVVADGGIKYSGDMVKALAVGASTVMLGSLFAGTREAPGEVVSKNGKQFKYYRGMGSIAAMKKGGAARYGQEVKKGRKLIAEGVEGLVPFRGTVEEFVTQMIGGLRTGMYYVGAKDLPDLVKRAKFVKISRAGLLESHPHDIVITNAGDNY